MRRRKKIKIYIAAIILLSVFILAFVCFERSVRPVIKSVAVSNAQSLAARTVSEVVNETMAQTHITYSDLVIFQKNQDENITAVTSNVVEMNKLKATLTSKIDERLSKTELLTSRIPLGSLLNQSLLSGYGPKVTIKLIPLGFTNINIRNEFSAAGINQTRHEIYLDVSCYMSVLMPVASQSTKITTQVPLAETIIVGVVPDAYTNVSGQEDPEDAALNLIPN